MNSKVAFIGSAGVPNNYGGFEMFLEACAPYLCQKFDEVVVTCDKSRYEQREDNWEGVKRVFIPIRANGIGSIFHDLFAFLAVIRYVNVIVVLGVSGGIFFPLFRLLSFIYSVKLIVNVDGVEWRRGKFSRAKRLFLFVSDRLAQHFSHQVIVDNEALRPFLIPKIQRGAVYIPYPGDGAVSINFKRNKKSKDLFLTICRIEPENNCHLLIEAFISSAVTARYVFVGNWSASDYGRLLRSKYAHVQNLELRDPVYDKEVVAELRSACSTYLHGHSVGGTNPSLVEMLFFDCEILAFDCVFNRSTAGTSIRYFSGIQDLAKKINTRSLDNKLDRTIVRARYTREQVCNAYEMLIQEPVGLKKPRRNSDTVCSEVGQVDEMEAPVQ